MTMDADTILGAATDPAFTGRTVHHVDIGWGDAGKHRQLVTTDTGIEVRIMLPRSTFLHDDAVIADDGTNVVVVRRPPSRRSGSASPTTPRDHCCCWAICSAISTPRSTSTTSR